MDNVQNTYKSARSAANLKPSWPNNMTKPNGYILYEGPSELDGKPIVMIATGFKSKSTNPKTGPMIQTYILRSDIPPLEAVKTGGDASICGDCKHRGNNGTHRTCYVQVQQGPNAVYKAYKAGKYTNATPISLRLTTQLLNDKSIRLGSYGDPAAIPTRILHKIVKPAKNHTGYTHFWNTKQDLKAFCMASVDSPLEAQKAQALGWRTFRVKNENDSKFNDEVMCPAVDKPGVITCESCKLCNGLSIAKNVVLNVHGAKWKIDNFKEL